jgi:hypothetical protein
MDVDDVRFYCSHFRNWQCELLEFQYNFCKHDFHLFTWIPFDVPV